MQPGMIVHLAIAKLIFGTTIWGIAGSLDARARAGEVRPVGSSDRNEPDFPEKIVQF
jgi:hypothetical protein